MVNSRGRTETSLNDFTPTPESHVREVVDEWLSGSGFSDGVRHYVSSSSENTENKEATAATVGYPTWCPIKPWSFTDFQKRVYKAVLSIPLGEVRSYNWVAKRIGRPNAVRAVGTALKKNPFTIVIPCHRVVKSDGSLGGYSRGVKNKKHLLALEKKIIELIK